MELCLGKVLRRQISWSKVSWSSASLVISRSDVCFGIWFKVLDPSDPGTVLIFPIIMARSAWKALTVAAAVVAVCNVCSLTFVPGPLRKAAPVAAASAAGMMLAPAAFADEIGDAAKKLGDASYAFAKEVDWNNGIFLQAPGKFQPLKALKAIDKMIEMGAAADPKLLKAAAEAHHKAIGSISGPNGVTSRADWDAVNAALGRVVASVPKEKVMAVYNSVKDITDPKVPAYMKSLVNGADAEKAYQGFLDFKDAVASATPKRRAIFSASTTLAQECKYRTYSKHTVEHQGCIASLDMQVGMCKIILTALDHGLATLQSIILLAKTKTTSLTFLLLLNQFCHPHVILLCISV